MDMPWLYFMISLGIGMILGAWLSRMSKENGYDTSIEQLEHDIDAMNEIEFLSPEDIELKKKDQQIIPWQVVDYGVNRVIKDLIKARFEPGIIVGVGRGGGIVACLLAGNLGNKSVAIIDRRLHYRDGKLISEFDEIPGKVLEAGKILLVIGGPSSGRAVLGVAQKISKEKISKEINHASEIKTVNLFEMQPIVYAADFRYKSFKTGIKPPWQIKEEYKAFGGVD